MKIRTKLLIFFVPLYLSAVIIMTTLAQYGVRSIVEQGVYNRGISVVTALAQNVNVINGFRTGTEQNLLPHLQAALEHTQARYVIALDTQARILAHTNVAETGKIHRDSMTTAAMNSKTVYVSQSQNEGDPILDIAQPIWFLPQTEFAEEFLLIGDSAPGEKTRIGTLRIGLPLNDALATANRITEQLFWIITLGSLLVLFFSLVFMRRILHPIHLLSQAAKLLGKGNLGKTVSVCTKDEVGELAESFNQMSLNLANTTVSKEYTDNILRSMNDALIVVSPNGRIEAANTATYKLLGYTEAELIGQPFDTILIHTNQMPLQASHLVEGQPVPNTEQTYRSKTGQEIPVLLSGAVLQNKEGHITGIVYAARDITDRKQAEADLLESEARFRRLSDSAFEGIFIHRGGVVLDANEQFARMLGFTSTEEVIGKNCWRYIGREARRRTIEHIRKNSDSAFEGTLITQSGEELPIEVIGRTAPYKGETVGVVAIRDIREQKQAAEARHLLERNLIQSERMAAVGIVAAGIVHNLKNPLTGILGFSELIQFKYPDIEEITPIHNSAVLMNEMIENILSKSRQKKESEAINISDLLKRELEFLEADKEFKNKTEVDLNLSDQIPQVWYPYTDLSQIFGNLLRNAVEAMYDQPEKTLSITTQTTKDTIMVRISDSGCGIAPDQLNQLFDPFFTTKTGDGISRPKGTGLGLYTVQKMLEVYDAKITVESTLEVGTTFQVSLPIRTSQADNANQSAKKP